MKTVTKFISEDGKEFSTEQECKDYEKTISDKKNAEKEKAKEIQKLQERLDYLNGGYLKLKKDMDSFSEKYPDTHLYISGVEVKEFTSNTVSEYLEKLFDLF